MGRSILFLIALGVAFHLVYLYSVIDMYFRSPLVHGMSPQQSPTPPLAKRLVLLVADGLRADKIFELDGLGKSRAPFLRSIIQKHGRWGVSHTRVPTESRPGHVAMISGFYEDMSSITTGWKTNPVEFDSVFNESKKTWAWGSPDILPMFAERTDHMDAFCYESDSEDFASDTTQLDSKAGGYGTALEQEGIIFFLHLLGIDTSGHAHKPYSESYYENIRVVDKGVADLYDLFEERYPDHSTAYVFTADHGMSDKGNHGDGETANTETPLVVWGAGFGRPQIPLEPHASPPAWHLEHLQRIDVAQADIAPLLASVLSLPLPLNSVGVLPVDFLDAPAETKSALLTANARQILAQYEMQARTISGSKAFWQPFPQNAELGRLAAQLGTAPGSGVALEVIRLSLAGLAYYQTYDRLLLIVLIACGYTGWILFSLDQAWQRTLDKAFTGYPPLLVHAGTGLVAALWLLCSLLQSFPLHYHLYFSFPCYFWNHLFRHHRLDSVRHVRVVDAISALTLLVLIATGFHYRYLFSVASVLLGLLPFVDRQHSPIAPYWFLSSVLVAVFPLLPVDLDVNIGILLIGGTTILVLGYASRWKRTLFFLPNTRDLHKAQTRFLLFQLGLVAASIVTMLSTFNHLSAGSSLPLVNQLAAWFLFLAGLASILAPVSHTDLDLTVQLFLGLAPGLLLLSVSYEPLFYAALAANLGLWRMLSNRVDSLRTSLFFLFYMYLSFFASGNIASFTSFQLAGCYRFFTVFDPFLMTALLVWKLLVYFITVTCVFTVILRSMPATPEATFLTTVALADVTSLTFFFLVRDSGSWLDIGVSLSHFILANGFSIFQMALFFLVRLLFHRIPGKRKY